MLLSAFAGVCFSAVHLPSQPSSLGLLHQLLWKTSLCIRSFFHCDQRREIKRRMGRRRSPPHAPLTGLLNPFPAEGVQNRARTAWCDCVFVYLSSFCVGRKPRSSYCWLLKPMSGRARRWIPACLVIDTTEVPVPKLSLDYGLHRSFTQQVCEVSPQDPILWLGEGTCEAKSVGLGSRRPRLLLPPLPLKLAG